MRVGTTSFARLRLKRSKRYQAKEQERATPADLRARRFTPAGFSWRPVLNLRAGRTPHLNCGIAGTLMRGGGGAATVGRAVLLLGLANILAVPICAPSAAFGRLPPIPTAPPPRPPPPRANEAAGVAKTMNNAIATFTFTEVFDMGKLH